MTSPLENTLANDFGQKHCVIDFETEGLNLISSKPFQISWAIFQGDRLIEEHNHYLFWSDLSISEQAARMTRFDWVKYKNSAENPKEIYRKFKKLLNDDSLVFVGHNILLFDVYILNIWQDLCKEDRLFPVERCIDTRALSVATQKNMAYYGTESFIAWQYKVLSIVERGLKSSQPFLLKKYGINYDKNKLHDALYDIKMTYKIFRKLLWEKCLDIPQFFWRGASDEFREAVAVVEEETEDTQEEELSPKVEQGLLF